MNCQNLIFKFLTLINNNGNQEKYWIDLLFEIEKENYIFDFIIFLQKQLTISNNELLYDIIDFLVDFSSEKTIILISKDNFLNTFISLLRKNARTSINLQKKIIFLIQKWGIKNKNYPNFKIKYDFLKKNGIVFPRIDFKLMTYDKYINVNSFKNNYNRKINQNKTNGCNLTFNNVNIGNENKKYNIIQYGNPYLNNSNNNQNIYNDIIYNENTKDPIYLNNMSSINNNLSNCLLENPENIKNIWREKIRIYNEYIDEGKYSLNSDKMKEGINELMENISPMENLIIQYSMINNHLGRHYIVNIRNDMEQTIYRYENLMRNNDVEPFFSSFDGNLKRYNINNPNIYKNNNNNSLKKSKIEMIKNGIYNFGNLIKEKSINGYEFVKEQINKEEKNEIIENYYYNQNEQAQKLGQYNLVFNKSNNNGNENVFNSVKKGLSKIGNSISKAFK